MVEDEGTILIERRDGRAVLVGKREVEDIEVLRHALGFGGLGDQDDAAIQHVAQGHLPDALAVLLADSGQNGIREESVGTLDERTLGHVVDAKTLHDLVVALLLPEDVGLDLVDRGDDSRESGDVNGSDGVEVGHPDGTNLPGLEGTLQVAVSTVVVAVGLVDQHEVDVVGSQSRQGLLNGTERMTFAVIRAPHLVDQEDLVARDATVRYGNAHALLVAVGLRRVDHAVPRIERGGDAALRLGVVDPENAVAQLGHRDSVVQGDGVHGPSSRAGGGRGSHGEYRDPLSNRHTQLMPSRHCTIVPYYVDRHICYAHQA